MKSGETGIDIEIINYRKHEKREHKIRKEKNEFRRTRIFRDHRKETDDVEILIMARA